MLSEHTLASKSVARDNPTSLTELKYDQLFSSLWIDLSKYDAIVQIAWLRSVGKTGQT